MFLWLCYFPTSVCQFIADFDRNSVQLASNKSADIRVVTDILGKYRTELLPVEVCLAGYRYDNNACVPCEPGSYSDTGGMMECKRCPEGSISAKAATVVSILVPQLVQ